MAKYMTKPREADAIQFDGTEASAREVIDWAEQLSPPLTVRRYPHKGSWNDGDPDLWLRLGEGFSSNFVEPGGWIVCDQGMGADVLTAAQFERDYTPA